MTASGPLRILLVEDNELDARMMAKSLGAITDTGFDITRVASLAAAMEALQDGHFDCTLLDLTLPDSVGLVSVEVLSTEAPGCPIVVLTGLDDPSTALEAVERGAQDYLNKQNVDPSIVARSIRYAVARHHSDLALRSATDQLALFRDRERIARDLHDTVIQQLFATGIGLQAIAGSLAEHEAHDRLLAAVDGIDGAIHQLREAIFGLHTAPEGIALADAIEELADEMTDSLGFRPLVEVALLPDDLSPDIRHEAVQVVSESLVNVAKHAEAAATKVVVEADGVSLVVSVTDNGRGIDPPAAAGDDHALGGNGLSNMRQRAASLGGGFHIGPGPGGGTRIEWTVPLS